MLLRYWGWRNRLGFYVAFFIASHFSIMLTNWRRKNSFTKRSCLNLFSNFPLLLSSVKTTFGDISAKILFFAQWKTHMSAKRKEIQLWFVVAGTERIIAREKIFLLHFRLYSVQSSKWETSCLPERHNKCLLLKEDEGRPQTNSLHFRVRFLTAINFLTFSLDSVFWQVWCAVHFWG